MANTSNKESIGNVLFVAIWRKPRVLDSCRQRCDLARSSRRQQLNEEEYRQRIILDVAGLYEPGVNIGQAVRRYRRNFNRARLGRAGACLSRHRRRT